MITVEVKINNKSLCKIKARNVSKKHGILYGYGKQIYKITDGREITHKFEDGAIKLAIEILEEIDTIFDKENQI